MNDEQTKTAVRKSWWRGLLGGVAGICALAAAWYYVPGVTGLALMVFLLLSLSIFLLMILAAWAYRVYEVVIGVAVMERRGIGATVHVLFDWVDRWLSGEPKECHR